MSLLDGRWVTDGGLETDLIFNRGVDLPEFASYPLVFDADGTELLRRYYAEYAEVAAAAGAGLLLETPTWRANADCGEVLGHDAAALDRANRVAVELTRSSAEAADVTSTRVSGAIGPRGDGYVAGDATSDEAAEYHAAQVASLAGAGADLVHAMTMTTTAEAIGIVRAARAENVPVAVSFTVETDGRLPDGRTLGDALTAVDEEAPADWYGLNCAHPAHVTPALDDGGWQERLTYFRPNASTMSHAELDEMEELDAGDIPGLAAGTAALREELPGVSVLGGCCGTDSRHVAALWGVPSPR